MRRAPEGGGVTGGWGWGVGGVGSGPGWALPGKDPVVTARGSAALRPKPHRPVDLPLPGGVSRAWFRAQSWQPVVVHRVGLTRSHSTPSLHRREARTQTTVHHAAFY